MFLFQDKDQRSMDMETAKAMLQLLLGKHWPLYSQFSQFLDQSKYKVINKDQWCNILEFSRTIYNDLSNYDVDGACKFFFINLKLKVYYFFWSINNIMTRVGFTSLFTSQFSTSMCNINFMIHACIYLFNYSIYVLDFIVFVIIFFCLLS